jgi:hypothetical protein
VAIVNIAYGKYEHILFCIPFIAAMVETGNKYRLYEIIGLYIVSIYLSIFLDDTTGTMALVISSCFLFTYCNNKKISRISIYLTSIIVYLISYFTCEESKNLIIHAFLDMAFYIACSMSIYFAVYRCIEENKSPDKPLAKEYFELLDKLNSLAHESINELKNARGKK